MPGSVPTAANAKTAALSRRGRGNAGAAAVGTAIGVIGGIIAVAAARREQAVEMCFRRYGRRFDPDTMTVAGRNGRRFPSP